MFIDKLLVMGDAQVITVTASTTEFIDTLAAADAYGDHARVRFLVDTAFVGQGATTLVCALETCAEPTFASPTVLAQSGAIVETSLIAGYVTFEVMIPSGVLRYLRGKYTVASGPMTAGKIDCRIFAEADHVRV